MTIGGNGNGTKNENDGRQYGGGSRSIRIYGGGGYISDNAVKRNGGAG
jgi:hypothetical protein